MCVLRSLHSVLNLSACIEFLLWFLLVPSFFLQLNIKMTRLKRQHFAENMCVRMYHLWESRVNSSKNVCCVVRITSPPSPLFFFSSKNPGESTDERTSGWNWRILPTLPGNRWNESKYLRKQKLSINLSILQRSQKLIPTVFAITFTLHLLSFLFFFFFSLDNIFIKSVKYCNTGKKNNEGKVLLNWQNTAIGSKSCLMVAKSVKGVI